VVTLALEALGEPGVRSGIDVLERHAFAELRGHRVALLTNQTGRDRAGRSTFSLLAHAPDVTLVAIFTPEHGLTGDVDRRIADGREPSTGLPIHSLYGDHLRPTEADLRGVDTLVVELADVGARFFTFETTLGYALEAAAAHGIRVMVLDRPNPLGGVAIEGPLLDAGRESFVAYHRLPLRHGMTLGELARLFNAERRIGADLTVIPVEGWRRADDLDAAGLSWRNPSPNLRSLAAAFAYPGLALLETTAVSVGRGTPRPFEVIGAPYVDGATLAAALEREGLPGVRFTKTRFCPTSSAFEDEECGGVELTLTDRARFESVRTGVAIARALHALYPEPWHPRDMMLLGHAATFRAIMEGDSLAAIASRWETDVAAFRAARAPYLLYP
jgi:uncharacterized protein YbbC (DUF1343 family)